MALLALDGEVLLQDGGHGSHVGREGFPAGAAARLAGIRKSRQLLGGPPTLTNKKCQFSLAVVGLAALREGDVICVDQRRVVKLGWKLQFCEGLGDIWGSGRIFVGKVLKLIGQCRGGECQPSVGTYSRKPFERPPESQSQNSAKKEEMPDQKSKVDVYIAAFSGRL